MYAGAVDAVDLVCAVGDGSLERYRTVGQLYQTVTQFYRAVCQLGCAVLDLTCAVCQLCCAAVQRVVVCRQLCSTVSQLGCTALQLRNCIGQCRNAVCQGLCAAVQRGRTAHQRAGVGIQGLESVGQTGHAAGVLGYTIFQSAAAVSQLTETSLQCLRTRDELCIHCGLYRL